MGTSASTDTTNSTDMDTEVIIGLKARKHKQAKGFQCRWLQHDSQFNSFIV
jgi:hypothetical protein